MISYPQPPVDISDINRYNNNNMSETLNEKKYLYQKRKEMIQELEDDDGYNRLDISIIFNIHKSRITRILGSIKKRSHN